MNDDQQVTPAPPVRIAWHVAATLLAAAPGRVRRRLDTDPDMAARWAWERDGAAWVVRAGTETVRIETETEAAASVVSAAEQLSCSCLLAPRCVHLLAVVAVLDPCDPEPETAAEPAGPPAEAEFAAAEAAGPGSMAIAEAGAQPRVGAETPAVQLTPRQRAAATLAWRTGAQLLVTGASAAGAVLRGDLLRAAHACQEAGLHRLGAAAVRVATGVRDLATARPEFELARLAEDVAELLAVAWRLDAEMTPDGGAPKAHAPAPPPAARPAPTLADIGVGRRHYEPVGTLRLHGLASEAVAATSGYAGVVTWLVDASGRVWSVSDVAPGPPSRAAAAYGSAVRLGQLALQHSELGRGTIIAQRASASADGRLGSGGGVTAVRTGPSSWDDAALSARWAEPLEDQLTRAWGLQELPVGERPASADLLFLQVAACGPAPGGLALAVSNSRRRLEVLGVAPSAHAELAYLPNLRRLAEQAVPLRLLARVRANRPRTVALLAASSPALQLPADWAGRVNLGLDRLTRSHFRTSSPAPRPSTEDGMAAPATHFSQLDLTEAPLEALRRVALRLLIGGRATLGAVAARTLEVEAARLRRAELPSAAAQIERLAAAGTPTRPAHPRLDGNHALPPHRRQLPPAGGLAPVTPHRVWPPPHAM